MPSLTIILVQPAQLGLDDPLVFALRGRVSRVIALVMAAILIVAV